MKKSCILSILVMSLALAACGRTEVCIYGGSSACATAAYSAAHEGCKVTVICPDVTIGGMTTGGLGQTDIGNKQAVTGLSRKFYRMLGEHYGKLEQWIFEPSVAEETLMKFLDSPRITLIQGFHIIAVEKNGTRITAIRCVDEAGETRTITADQFIDCSYEGDLMALSGVTYRVGREDNSEYSETWDGYQMLGGHQFRDGVDPFVEKGNPDSGLLWGISDLQEQPAGSGNNLVQAYNYRICLTDDPDNMIPLERPADYDSTRYELLVRVFESDPDPKLNNYFIWSRMPNHKTDINNRGPFSTDMIGMNHDYPEASWERRQEIIEAHKSYTLGLLYFYMTDPRVPSVLQEEVRRWGLPKDEYVRTDHWTHQLYLRECRRLVGEYVATQADCENRTEVPDGVGFAAYTMDSHNCERIVICRDGKYMVKNEGNVEVPGGHPYPVSYRSLTPKREECTNLLVPVCLSASHIAYGSIRMEPVFLEMGQASGLAAAMAGRGSVQEIDVPALCDRLVKDPCLDGKGPDILIDEGSEYLTVPEENWKLLHRGGCYGKGYYEYYGTGEANGFEYRIPEILAGEYDFYLFEQNHGCPQTKYVVSIGDMTDEVIFDRTKFVVEGQAAGEWFKLGTYSLKKGQGGSITLSSEVAGLHADALLLIGK